MKKKNIALALLATGCAAGPALAQSSSSVSLYGIIDVSVRAQSGLSGANAPAGGSMGSVNSGVGPTSRWGIRGSEDLGGGLRAIFNLESTLGADVGGIGGVAGTFDRAAIVGLAGHWGAVTAGRQNTLISDSVGLVDPIALRFAGLNPNIQVTSLTGHGLNNEWGATNTKVGSNRVNNSIKYSGSFGGLTARAMYSFGETGVSASRLDTRGLGLDWRQDDLVLTSAYTQFHDASGRTLDAANIGGAWSRGDLRLMLNYGRNKAETSDTAKTTNKILALGARYAVTPVIGLNGGYYKVDRERTGQGDDGFQRLIGFVDYQLSKRTSLFLELDTTKWKNGYQGAGNKTRASGISLGITHNF